MAFRLRPVTAEDYPRMVEIMRGQMPDPPTVEDLLHEDQARGPGEIVQRVAAVTPDGQFMGYGVASRSPMMKEGQFSVNVRVDRPYRREGIGTALYREAERIALEHGTTKLTTHVREEDPADLKWAQNRGFTVDRHLFESTLDLAQYDPTPFLGAVVQAREAGIRFASLADYPINDETLQRFIDLFWEMAQDIPGSDGEQKPTLDMIKRHLVQSEYWEPEAIIFAVDGETDRWAALAWVQRRPNGSYYHSFTGVARDYRGRNLALAVKVVALDYVRAKGVPYIRTHNDSANERMLKVNRKMGFRPEPGVLKLIKSTD